MNRLAIYLTVRLSARRVGGLVHTDVREAMSGGALLLESALGICPADIEFAGSSKVRQLTSVFCHWVLKGDPLAMKRCIAECSGQVTHWAELSLG
jgi:hypothetical protein